MDSLFNQLIVDLTQGHPSVKNAKISTIDFVFTTRSRSLITEFANRNKAWQLVEEVKEEKEKEKELNKISSHFSGFSGFSGFSMEEVEQYHTSTKTRKILKGKVSIKPPEELDENTNVDKIRYSLELEKKDR